MNYNDLLPILLVNIHKSILTNDMFKCRDALSDIVIQIDKNGIILHRKLHLLIHEINSILDSDITGTYLNSKMKSIQSMLIQCKINDELVSSQILSLDFWDTLVCRVKDHEYIKMETMVYLLDKNILDSKYNIRLLYEIRMYVESMLLSNNNNEFKYNLRDVFVGIIEILFGVNDILVNDLLLYECDLEKQNVYLNHDLLEYIERFTYTEIYITSDYHLGSNHLDAILKRLDCSLPINRIIVSCDSNESKKSGKLFSYIGTDAFIHIGDDIEADVMPICNSVLYTGTSQSKYKKYKDFYYYLRKLPINIYDVASLTGISLNVELGREMATYLYNLYYDFCKYIETTTTGTIYFCTREGTLLKKLYDIYCDKNDIIPNSVLLELSRKSIFLPSLHKIFNLSTYMNNHVIVQRRSLFSSLGIPDHKSDPTAYVTINDIDTSDIEYIKMESKKAYNNAIPYFLKYPDIDSIIDLGWFGSTSIYLSNLLSKTINDVYMFSIGGVNHRCLYRLDGRTMVSTYPLEYLSTLGDTVVSYKDGISVTLPVDTREVFSNYVSEFQDELVNLFDSENKNDYSSVDYINRLIPNHLAIRCFCSEHDEGYGLGGLTHSSNHVDARNLIIRTIYEARINQC